jgi:protein Mpv17
MKTGTTYLFKKHLLLTNLGISAGLSATGDSIQQHYEKIKDPERNYNYRRTFNMSTAGVTIGGVCHFWYQWLDKFLPGRTLSIALKKVLQILFKRR